MYYMQIKIEGAWQFVTPTKGEPYKYGTKEEAERMLQMCYPDQLLVQRLGGEMRARVVEECPACHSINPHQAEREGYTGLCDNCEVI